MVTVNSFPQNGDEDYAEDFRAWLGRSNITDYVEEGMEFMVDESAPDISIGSGKAFVSQPKEDVTEIGETRLVTDMAVHLNGGILPLTDNTVNHVYIVPKFGTNDSAEFAVYESEVGASSNSLKIGEVDMNVSPPDITMMNRYPDVEVENFRAYRDLGIPVYDELSEAPGGSGNIVYITGDGSDRESIYRHDGSSFEPVQAGEISDIPNVSGITGLTEDISDNRPSAGDEGHIFFETDTKRIQYDTGDSWVTLGENSENIDAGDLGFDPATQSELDDHTSTGDAHHAKTSTLDELNDTDVSEIIVDTSSNIPDGGSSGRLFLERDTGRVLYDGGSGWSVLGVSSHAELDGVSVDDHHERYTDDEAQQAIEEATITFENTPHLPGAEFDDSDGSGATFTITEDSSSGNLEVRYGSTPQHAFLSNGDVRISGTLSENKSL